MPFLEKHFHSTENCFMQDNDPKHTSRTAKEFYEEKGISWWPTPISSADFNPIEHVWRELKPLNTKELEGICLFCRKMSPERCNK